MKALLLPFLLLLLCFIGIITQGGKGNVISFACTAPIVLYGLYEVICGIIGFIKDRKK